MAGAGLVLVAVSVAVLRREKRTEEELRAEEGAWQEAGRRMRRNGDEMEGWGGHSLFVAVVGISEAPSPNDAVHFFPKGQTPHLLMSRTKSVISANLLRI